MNEVIIESEASQAGRLLYGWTHAHEWGPSHLSSLGGTDVHEPYNDVPFPANTTVEECTKCGSVRLTRK